MLGVLAVLLGWGAGAAVLLASASEDRVPTAGARPASSELGVGETLPASLRETGLYAHGNPEEIAADVLPYAPQYPLWSDGARKRRWVRLPPGARIDASDPNVWAFPLGTRFWKEFAFQRRAETRFMERTSAGWLFGTYVWNADESDAVLAPERGAATTAQVASGVAHVAPALVECRGCHDDTAPVLGFSALQLSPDRDRGALRADAPSGSIDLRYLLDRDLVRGIPDAWRRNPPRIAARSARERSALGYLHGNCGGCHNDHGPLSALGLKLAYDVTSPETGVPDAIATTFEQPSRFVPASGPFGERPTRIVPGDPRRSVLLARMGARDAVTQMPPYGTRIVDAAAVELVEQWITETPELRASRQKAP